MKKNVGLFAERYFSLLCSQEGVVCNRSSDEDAAAWDYVVHLPREGQNYLPIDEGRGYETVFVQVKSTRRSSCKVELKLSNALKMVKERNPFFLVLFVDRGSEPRFLARHFWADEIEHTLRRVRQADSKNQGGKLNRLSITFTLDENDDRTDNLLSWMQSVTGAIRGDYGQAKLAISECVGYEAESTKIVMQLQGRKNDLVNWELGLNAVPQISAVSATSTRFGIELPTRNPFAGFRKFEINPVGDSCSVILKHDATGERVILSGKMFRSAIAPFVEENVAWRADFKWLDLIARSNDLQGRIRIEYGKVVAITELRDLLIFSSWSGKGEFAIELFLGALRGEIGKFDLKKFKSDLEWNKFRLWVEMLVLLSDNDPVSNPSFSLSEIIDSSIYLDRFYQFYSSAVMRIEHNPSIDDDPTHSVIYFLRCNVGSWCFFSFIRREVAVDNIVDGKRTLYLKNAELLEAHVLEGRWEDRIGSVLTAYHQRVRGMGDPTFFWDLGDLEAWIAKINRIKDDRI